MSFPRFHIPLFQSSESRFCLTSALSISMIPLAAAAITSYVLWIFLNFTHSFFEAAGLPRTDTIKMAYFDFLTRDVFDQIPYLAGFIILLFFVGYYIGKLFLRPFDEVAEFATKAMKDPKAEITPVHLFGLNPMTNFSHVFFKFYYHRKSGNPEAAPFEYDAHFNRYTRPGIDFNLFAYSMVFVLLFSSITGYFVFIITNDIHANMVQLALETLRNRNATMNLSRFLDTQNDILTSTQIISFIVIFVMYTRFIFGRFARVSGPAFAFFRAMKSYVDGDSRSQVYLRVGDPVHRQSDVINQFMKSE